MSWEPSFRRSDNSSLGNRDEVCDAISQAFPGTIFKRAPSGQEMLAEMLRSDPSLPESSRNLILRTPSQWHGVYETDQVSVQFVFACEDEIAWISISSHGNHEEAKKRLRILANEKGWMLDGYYEQ